MATFIKQKAILVNVHNSNSMGSIVGTMVTKVIGHVVSSNNMSLNVKFSIQVTGILSVNKLFVLKLNANVGIVEVSVCIKE